MINVEKQANEFVRTRATSTLCHWWKTLHDHLLERMEFHHEMLRIEDELERRFPEAFREWIGSAEDDYAAYCEPRRFFTIENAEEARLRPEICF